MKKLMTLLALFCWQNAQTQEVDFDYFWLIETTSYPSFENQYPQSIEKSITFAFEDNTSFHYFSLNTSGSISSINGFILKKFDPYINLSCNPKTFEWYSSIGVSKSLMLSEKINCTAYLELGIFDIVPKSWCLNIGMIHYIELPNFKKNRKWVF
ncbi:MAG: hypothetical protein KBC12_02885 [Candidatus Pacebacteria bacterium]|jgi:hypothetical protein|nr:hypothetical protein [Candidatus Paceibacterota bacterium]MBP9851386.1 hypothetical protein [Candidatus Paceibacterota bacterium]